MTDDLARACAELGDDPEVRALLTRVCDLTGMGFAALAFVSERRWVACQVEDRVAFGLKPGDELEIKQTICHEIRDCGRAIAVDDVGSDPDWWNHPVPILYGFRSYVSLPLKVGDKFFGTLCALDDAPRERSLQLILDELEAVAEQLASIVESRFPPEAIIATGTEQLPQNR